MTNVYVYRKHKCGKRSFPHRTMRRGLRVAWLSLVPARTTCSLASIPSTISCLDVLAGSSRAWSIDDVVQDVVREVVRDDGSVKKVLTTEAWVHHTLMHATSPRLRLTVSYTHLSYR